MLNFAPVTFTLFDKQTTHGNENMTSAHFHNKHELYYLENGRAVYYVEDKIYILESGDFIFIPAGKFHYTNYAPNTVNERIIFAFDDDFIGWDYKNYIDRLSVDRYVHIPKNHIHNFQELFRKIEQESHLKQSGYLDAQKLYLRLLLVMLLRYKKDADNTDISSHYAIIQNAAEFIRTNFNSDLTRESIAKKYFLSPDYFSKLFKSVVGIGLREYITFSRISEAQKLLETTNLSIAEIATKCGFNDSNYFAYVFKKIKGTTPKKYSKLFFE